MGRLACGYGVRTEPEVVRAAQIAHQMHGEQRDKGGRRYFWHPFFVAAGLRDAVLCQGALLHDVLEDTTMTCVGLRRLGISAEVIKLVLALSRPPRMPYRLYVRRLRTNQAALAIKEKDLLHNSDRHRLKPMRRRDFARHHRYRQALRMINGFKKKNNGYMDSNHTNNMKEMGVYVE